MSKTLASQIIITAQAQVLRNSTVHFDAEIKQFVYSSIIDGLHERANTVFYDGILSPPVILKNPIINFKTEKIEELQFELISNLCLYSEYDAIDLIISLTNCTSNNYQDELNPVQILWSGLDLVNKKITGKLSLTVISL